MRVKRRYQSTPIRPHFDNTILENVQLFKKQSSKPLCPNTPAAAVATAKIELDSPKRNKQACAYISQPHISSQPTHQPTSQQTSKPQPPQKTFPTLHQNKMYTL